MIYVLLMHNVNKYLFILCLCVAVFILGLFISFCWAVWLHWPFFFHNMDIIIANGGLCDCIEILLIKSKYATFIHIWCVTGECIHYICMWCKMWASFVCHSHLLSVVHMGYADRCTIIWFSYDALDGQFFSLNSSCLQQSSRRNDSLCD